MNAHTCPGPLTASRLYDALLETHGVPSDFDWNPTALLAALGPVTVQPATDALCTGHCLICHFGSPCDTAVALAEVDRLTAALVALESAYDADPFDDDPAPAPGTLDPRD